LAGLAFLPSSAAFAFEAEVENNTAESISATHPKAAIPVMILVFIWFPL
jgi:hypothetical protein